ncbi:hypothetical protein GCM10008107_27400 [Psychrosphaera saromensis]|uniref:DUF1697 domain-containing protein n=1 Tax=Psychrosphaera saromensis TaxID=716813 RepID=A0A2S7UVM8_9GAMM|nr:DUF1697 domain-containing protein [Psychrosphaera saromensis]PQJ54046.1 hypothetical protein BTO11_10560 [Psychrosphaera saromensis]GHB76413.1 hypothetical protein GCM10008107_27400 [Psychrosphaera saromensis]GLQ14457.1 hypothetical protein GCM10007917_19120 [Psychrosphaera saromensis]
MQTFVILLRGINVGGNNLLPMKTLVPLLIASGYQDISTYIQTGNIVLTSNSDSSPEQDIKALITEQFGFTPNIFVIAASEFSESVANNPYQDFEGKFVHFYFCQQAVELQMDNLTKWLSSTETYQVNNNVFYLHAPDGIGRSKLVANIESCLGQPATGRNLNTVNKITTMIGGK